MDAQDIANTTAWDRLACDHSATAQPQDPARIRITWTPRYDEGPGIEILDCVDGKDVVELGCHRGDLVALLHTLGARTAVGVDSSAASLAWAQERWSALPDIQWRVGDAGDALASTPDRYDLVVSVCGALFYSDPERLLPLVHARLRPGGLLAFSAIAPAPGQAHGPTAHQMRAGDGSELPVVRHMYDLAGWRAILDRHHFTVEQAIEVLSPPEAASHGTVIVTARRAASPIPEPAAGVAGRRDAVSPSDPPLPSGPNGSLPRDPISARTACMPSHRPSTASREGEAP